MVSVALTTAKGQQQLKQNPAELLSHNEGERLQSAGSHEQQGKPEWGYETETVWLKCFSIQTESAGHQRGGFLHQNYKTQSGETTEDVCRCCLLTLCLHNNLVFCCTSFPCDPKARLSNSYSSNTQLFTLSQLSDILSGPHWIFLLKLLFNSYPWVCLHAH